ncbi:MAG: tRNA preQ1(34) S-adenosylmethionine ribosyltransferase-isomerase QueA, partial [Chitinophagales bacterium]|nr:tRNA preQ1(34) S-adenosylmethionine ribosyltransferase-isomerase QueA [Hyphomicrobiales bacterium]
DFDFHLPDDRIALRPPSPRGSGRLLHIDPSQVPRFQDRCVSDLLLLLRPDDILVLNDTRVVPAQLRARRHARSVDGETAEISLTMHQRQGNGAWRAFAKPGKRLRAGDMLSLATDNAALIVREKLDGGEFVIASATTRSLDSVIEAHGVTPLPPYIASRRLADARDVEDYQTVFAARPGAVAAPTAGLHLTPELLATLAARGVRQAFVTLHVGAGTFLPVKDNMETHVIHAEWGEITEDSADAINAARAKGGRIVACGTTALRLLETAAAPSGEIRAFSGETSIFIKPGHTFRGVDLLMTNFHLPRSTLFMLVAAFSGLATMQAAYAHAIEAGYMFYSYGDTSLLHPASLPQPEVLR